MLELEDIRREHEDIYKELQGCYGLEKCLGQFNLLDANVGKSNENISILFLNRLITLIFQ